MIKTITTILLNQWKSSPLVIANFTTGKDSKWVYSSKHEEKLYRNAGTISIFTHVSPDTHNASLRLAQRLSQAHVVLTNDPKKV